MKDALYATQKSVVDQCPRRDALLVLGDFNTPTRTDREGYETCVSPHVSGTVNQNSNKFPDFEEAMDLGWLVHGFSSSLDLVFQHWWCGKGN